MYLRSLEVSGFKSFGKKESFDFNVPIAAIVGPNGSGKSNIAEAFRFVLGEQSLKSMRGKKGEDLIWGGGKDTARSNRASVKVVFDNQKRLFDMDFDEVTIERVVHRDGINQYSINGTQVRLRDVVEMLAHANIGSSGHHIISQGEADRILNTSPRERREMVEDALGLRVYHHKLAESEKKLEKTEENIAQVKALRKEIAPHLRFLKKQAERVEKTQQLREDLEKKYMEYLKRESVYLAHGKDALEEERREPQARLAALEQGLARAKEVLERERAADGKSNEIIELEKKLRIVREKKDVLARDIGRVEGELRAEERNRERASHIHAQTGARTVELSSVKRVLDEVRSYVDEGETSSELTEVKTLLRRIRDACTSFITREEEKENTSIDSRGHEEELERLKKVREKLIADFDGFEKEEQELRASYDKLKESIESVRDKSREAERAMFTIMTEQNDLRAKLAEFTAREQELLRLKEQFDRDVEEGLHMIGHAVLAYEEYRIVGSDGSELPEESIASEKRQAQEERRRDIEKIKIRIEEFGAGGGDDILKEYQEIEERDNFLEREVADLEQSAESLRHIMKELEETLQSHFANGIKKINTAFEQFFSVMFGGGHAELKLMKTERRRRLTNELDDEDLEEKPETEEGLEVAVSLPKKRIKGLVMLSGGERALTSIALLFAMSQVNPPPFLILDETDAALDEANSRRYGDMIEDLSKHSQLIVITHNRETMSRASVLYGVTMGSEGQSKVLSIKFDEAVKVAK